MLAAVWPDVVVTTDSLSQCVVELRSALKDPDQAIVRTVPRLGYRFDAAIRTEETSPERSVAEVVVTPPQPVRSGSGRTTVIAGGLALAAAIGLIAVEHASTPAPRIDSVLAQRRSLAVFPLTDFTESPTPHLAAALTAEIVTDVGNLRDTPVVAGVRLASGSSPDADWDLKDSGRRLGVRHVLAGSITQGGAGIQVRMRLTRADSGAVEWVQVFSYPDAAAPGWRQDVSHRITAMVDSKLVDGDVHADPRDVRINAAVDEWSSGVYWMRRLNSRANVLEARRHFQAALDLDPGSILALSGLAGSYLEEVTHRWSPDRKEAVGQARAYALRAMAVDPDHPESLRTLGNAYLLDGRFDEAEPAFRKALELEPSSPVAQRDWASLLLFTGRFAEAMPYARTALKLDSQNLANVWKCHAILAQSLMMQNRTAEGLEELRLADLAHPNFAGLQYMIAAAEAGLGRIDDARRDLAELQRRNPNTTIASIQAKASSRHPRYVAGMKWLYDGLRLAGLAEG